MNIESKRYHVRSMFAGGVEIMEKETGACRVVDSFHSAAALASMSERAFNRACSEVTSC